MDQDRRSFLKEAGKLLMLTGAASIAWDSILAGAPQLAPNYNATEHWWGMMIDIDKCIGCGNCVRACKTENDVLDEPGNFRTWVERYQVNATTRNIRSSTRPTAATTGSSRSRSKTKIKIFFVPKLCNHCAHSPCVQVCPVGATFESPDGVVLVDKTRCLGCRYCVQACPYGCRFIDPRTDTVDKCTLCYHRITKGLTTACCETCPTGARMLADLKNPKDPIHAFLRDAHGAGAQAADGDRLEGVLQRARRLGALDAVSRPVPAAPAGRVGGGETGPGKDRVCQRRRVHLPERARAPVERAHRPLPVHHGPGGRRVHPRVARARVQRAGGQAHLPARAADRPGLPARRAAAAAAAPRASRAVLRDVPHAAHPVGHGDVRLRLPLVPDGRPRARDLARLPAGHRPEVAREHGAREGPLRRDGALVGQHQRVARSGSTTGSAAPSPSSASRRRSCCTGTSGSSSGRSRPTRGGPRR